MLIIYLVLSTLAIYKTQTGLLELVQKKRRQLKKQRASLLASCLEFQSASAGVQQGWMDDGHDGGLPGSAQNHPIPRSNFTFRQNPWFWWPPCIDLPRSNWSAGVGVSGLVEPCGTNLDDEKFHNWAACQLLYTSTHRALDHLITKLVERLGTDVAQGRSPVTEKSVLDGGNGHRLWAWRWVSGHGRSQTHRCLSFKMF